MNWFWRLVFGPHASMQAPNVNVIAGNIISATAVMVPKDENPPGRIKLVEQTTKFNCGAAALAMILGLSTPEQVEREYIHRDTSTSHGDRGIAHGQIGVFMEEAQRVLFEAGIPAVPYVNRLQHQVKQSWVCRVWDRVRIADHNFLRRHLAKGGVAMLTVPSLNRPGGEHWIVMAGEKIFDPSTGRKYRSYAQISVLNDAILIGIASSLKRAGA